MGDETGIPRRRLEGRLDAPLKAAYPEGPAWPAGTEFALSMEVNWPRVGPVTFAIPDVASLLLNCAYVHLGRADSLRPSVEDGISEDVVAATSTSIATNEDALFDFFEEAFAGIVLAHGALDNFCNDRIPSGATIEGEQHSRKNIQHRGIIFRLTKVLPDALGRPEVPARLLERIESIKNASDEVVHVKDSTMYTSNTADRSVFAWVVNENYLSGIAHSVLSVFDHFGWREEAA